MKWVTRKGAKVDRIACPWLIKRFIDKDAEFIFVPEENVFEVAKSENAIPFDVKGAELGHYYENGREYVSFDAIIRKYQIKDPALLLLARIVRSADARIEDPAPEGEGLRAAAEGFRLISKDDHENMKLQFPLYDALYAYCIKKVSEGNTQQDARPPHP